MAAKKRKKAVLKVVYDQNYYKAAAMLKDPWFKEKEAWLRKRFRDVGCPLPPRPFKKSAEYMAWNDRLWERYAEMERSPEFIAEKNRITGSKEMMSAEEYYALEEFRENFLPPMYGQVFTEILRHYEIDDKNAGFREFLELYFFFGREEYRTAPFDISWRRDPKGEVEFLIKIHAHTTREDFLSHWGWIAENQKLFFKNPIGKNKPWETFDRDLEIYREYQKLKKEAGPRSANGQSLDRLIYRAIGSKWPDVEFNHIRSIITKTRKRLGEI
ncbi:MAG TPA: hypothetical protein VGP13_03455 [Candidatus Paceibacterota bacterium]|jgi:hypothetical protein|nr:hypothetical protein [Candidatus Paceibacterota bacterium]